MTEETSKIPPKDIPPKENRSSKDNVEDRAIAALNKLTNAEKQAQAKTALELGQALFERGRYRKAIQQFQNALSLSNPMGTRGGEIQMWLVNAYVAAGDNEAGLALCRKLILHPDLETKRQSKRLLYILEAPELEMKPEWVTKIPDLAGMEDDKGRAYVQKPKRPRRRKPKPEPEPLDLSQVNTEDNQFVWIALAGILLTIGGLFLLS
ncbi:MAG: tetratricopeptide repeat protein [Cyanobacteria bacterium P01_D01_bin.105]